jgi:hypothetical protein
MADIRSYEIPEGMKLRKGAKSRKAVEARTIRNFEIPYCPWLGEVEKATEDFSEDLRSNLRDLRIKEPRITINRNNSRTCEVTHVKTRIFKVLFERLKKLSLPSMAVGEKQKVT